MDISRRNFMKGVGAAGTSAAVIGASACSDDSSYNPPPYTFDEAMFEHGVASGDPLADRVILWTRVTQSEQESVQARWEVASDPHMQRVVASGMAPVTSAARDFTVKVDVTELSPSTTYYYRFYALGSQSPIGRTRTAPASGVVAEHIRLAFCSCSSLAHGYFHAYREIAQQPDLDVVVHLGDYMYEYKSGGYGGIRQYEPANELVAIEDYRIRHAQHKRDPDLQEAHRQHPFIVVWDDHESANNSWKGGAGNHQPEKEGAWEDRKNAAIQAYSEWMPIRDQEDTAKIWRGFHYGNLFDLIMLDTRLWGREKQNITLIEEPDRQLLGEDQQAWFHKQLAGSDAIWKIVGQQVMFGQLLVGEGNDAIINPDQWNGYLEARTRVYDAISANDVENFVVLTGDIHTSWAMELSTDPQNPEVYNPETGEGSLGVEFVVTSVTSPSIDAISGIRSLLDDLLRELDPHIKYYELVKKGYGVLDITPERLQTDYYYVSDVEVESYEGFEVEGSFYVDAGTNHLVPAEAVAPPKPDAPDPAPEYKPELVSKGFGKGVLHR